MGWGFSKGRLSINDNRHTIGPKSTVTRNNIVQVRNILKNDRRVTGRGIAKCVGISTDSEYTFSKKKLKYKKVCARWIPHILSVGPKKDRLQKAKKLLERLKNLTQLLTGDET